MEKKRLSDILSIILSSVTLFTVISGGFFWFHQTNALPKRMDRAEERISQLEEQIISNNTKTDLIMQAVYEIRGVLLKK